MTETEQSDESTSSSRRQEDGENSFREFREYARGQLDVDHQDVYPWAGLIDDQRIRSALAFLKREYEPGAFGEPGQMPSRFEGTELFRAAIRKYGTEAASRAVAEGDHRQLAMLSGLPGYRSDISGIHAIEQLGDWLVESERCKIVYLAALMGRGKTDFALTLLEVVDYHFRRIRNSSAVDESVPRPEFATNFSAEATVDDVEIETMQSFDELTAWADEGSSDDERWFVFDESSTHLTAQSGANAQKVAEVMAPFVKRMRKSGINLITIGHDAQDVAPAIREIADFVDKPSLKTASFYAGIDNRQPVGHLFDVEGIPQTSWRFDTDDMAEWSWGSAVEDGEGGLEVDPASRDDLMTDEEFRAERNERIARLWATTELSQSDVAEVWGLTQPQVSDICDKQIEQNDDGSLSFSGRSAAGAD